MEIELAGEKVLLTENKFIFWPKEQTAFIADLHLGKTSHFRKSGIAIPVAVIQAEIDRIEKIILKYRPKRVFFLGDLFHSDLNHEWNIFSGFLKQHSTIQFVLIKGNHDILSEKIYDLSLLHIEVEPFYLQPFILSHHPIAKEEINEGFVNLCGHLHPGISIKGKGRSHLSLACFYLEDQRMTLPAFGRFTGLAKIKPKQGSSTFVVLQASVKKLG